MLKLLVLLIFVLSASSVFGATTQTATMVLTWNHTCCANPQVNDAPDGFNVERGPTPTGPFVEREQIMNPQARTFTDVIPGDTGNTQYCYRVSAFNQFGTSNPSNTACATTPAIQLGPLDPVIKSVTVTVTINLQ